MGQIWTVLSVLFSLVVLAVLIFVGYNIYQFFEGHKEGTTCDKPNNTIWIGSGCDISAGHCCWIHPDHGFCHGGACEGAPTGAMCGIDSDCLQTEIITQKCNASGRCMPNNINAVCPCVSEGNCPDGNLTYPFSGCTFPESCCSGKCGTGLFC